MLTAETAWAAYIAGNFQECLRLTASELAAQGAFDLVHIAGLSLLQMRRFDEGLQLLKTAVMFRPDAPHIYTNAAYVTEQLMLPEALEYFIDAGLRDFPDNEALHRHKANLALIKMDYLTATASYKSILRVNPDDVPTHINLANTYRFRALFDLSAYHLAEAAKRNPTTPILLTNLVMSRAALMGELGQVEAALALLDGVQDDDCLYMHAIFLLSVGAYERGWQLHRGRRNSLACKQMTAAVRPFERLEQAGGKRIAVLREGGFGDVFQFLRYIQMLAPTVSEILFHAMPSEERLLRANVPANVTIRVTANTTLSIENYYEHTVALLDLPYFYGTTLDTIPAVIPYMQVPLDARIQRRLPPPQARYRVGLAWAGGAATGVNERGYDIQRSIKLSEFAGLAELADIEFVSLQYGPRRTNSGLQTTTVLDDQFDWLDTAAIIAQLDLVITVDTAIVHLAGAMGKPTWLLSRFNPCWRWLRNQPESPWYPGVVRVFGQPAFGDWTTPIAEIKRALVHWLQSPRATPDMPPRPTADTMAG